MHIVYWTVTHEDGPESKSKPFTDEDLSAPLKFMEELRQEQYETGNIRFIVMASENPNNVGKPGVAAAGPDYDWTKRRGGSNRPSKDDLSHYKDH